MSMAQQITTLRIAQADTQPATPVEQTPATPVETAPAAPAAQDAAPAATSAPAAEPQDAAPAAESHEAAPAADGHEAAPAADAHGATDGTHATTEAHGGEHGGAFPPFDSSTFASQLLWLAITFAALYLLMSKLVLPRIGEILEVRRDRIEGDLAEAERLRVKTDQALAAYEAALASAKAKAHGIADETRAKLKTDIDGRRTQVETDLAKKVSAAEARIQATKTEALGNVDEIAAETAAVLVSQLTGKVTAKAAKDAVAKAIKA